jgi:hypothetical protein
VGQTDTAASVKPADPVVPRRPPAEPEKVAAVEKPAAAEPKEAGPPEEVPPAEAEKPPEAAKPPVGLAPAPPAPPAGETLPLRVQLVRFGPARIQATEYAGKSLLGALVEVEANVSRHAGTLKGSTVVAVTADGAEVPGEAVFIAAGREWLAPTATLLAGTAGKNWLIAITREWFDPGVSKRFGAALSAVETKVEATARLVVPAGMRVFNASDMIAAMPIQLKTGGIELTFLQNQKVQLGVVFSGEVERFKSLKLLGQSVPLDAVKLDRTPPPPPAVARGPAFPGPGFGPPGFGPPGFMPRPGPAAPRELPPLNVRPGPDGRVPEVYRFRPQYPRGVPSRNIRVFEENDGKRRTTALKPGGFIGYAQDGPSQIYNVDVLGSTGIHVVVNRRRGYTTVAGLRFRSDAVIALSREGVVEVNRIGVAAIEDGDGARYTSRLVTINGRRVIAMVKAGRAGR